jgi:hypothetical protein
VLDADADNASGPEAESATPLDPVSFALADVPPSVATSPSLEDDHQPLFAAESPPPMAPARPVEVGAPREPTTLPPSTPPRAEPAADESVMLAASAPSLAPAAPLTSAGSPQPAVPDDELTEKPLEPSEDEPPLYVRARNFTSKHRRVVIPVAALAIAALLILPFLGHGGKRSGGTTGVTVTHAPSAPTVVPTTTAGAPTQATTAPTDAATTTATTATAGPGAATAATAAGGTTDTGGATNTGSAAGTPSAQPGQGPVATLPRGGGGTSGGGATSGGGGGGGGGGGAPITTPTVTVAPPPTTSATLPPPPPTTISCPPKIPNCHA